MPRIQCLRTLVCLTLPALLAATAAADEPTLGCRLRSAAGCDAGLIVHVGCTDGMLTCDLADAPHCIVQGLSVRAEKVSRARDYITRQGSYGRVSATLFDGKKLPFADSIVNLLVVSDAGDLPAEELLRVVRPGGALVVKGVKDGLPNARAVNIDGWSLATRPRPETMDEWGHRCRDAGGNAVSRDRAIGPLTGVRWIAGPAWPMGTYYQVSNATMVSAGGRVFSATSNDVTNYPLLPVERDNRYLLVARDAFNGLLLWRRPFDPGRPDALVATADRVYAVTEGKLSALEAATGKIIWQHEAAESWFCLALSDGKLVAAGGKAVGAFDPDTGKEIWREPADARELRVDGGRVFYATHYYRQIIVRSLADGKQLWEHDLADMKGGRQSLLFAADGTVAYVWAPDLTGAERQEKYMKVNGIAIFNAADGKLLWKKQYDVPRAHWPYSSFYVDGLLWLRSADGGWQGLELKTGRADRSLPPIKGYCGGCTRDIATEQYLISTRPLNFFRWTDGERLDFHGGRHSCRAGVVIANGLLYTQPQGCKCVRGAVRGFVAFGSDTVKDTGLVLERGPAFGQPVQAATDASDWPTFRADPQRSGKAAGPGPADPRLVWQTRLADAPVRGPVADEWSAHWTGGELLTAPVVAGGKVFVGLVESHRVMALDAKTGRPAWSFTTGGRVSAPPTIHAGLCLVASHDGSVYCLRADAGQLVWQLRPAEERCVVAFGQIESARPIIGGLLVHHGKAYFVTGRSAGNDGGLVGFAVEPATGKILWQAPLTGGQSDVLVADGDRIRMAGGASTGILFDPNDGKRVGEVKGGFQWHFGDQIATLWAGSMRLVDRSWQHLSSTPQATGWMRHKQAWGPLEGMLAVGDLRTGQGFAYRFRDERFGELAGSQPDGSMLPPADEKQPPRPAWTHPLDELVQIVAMALAGDRLYAAGPANKYDPTDGGRLIVLSCEGKLLTTQKLDAVPASDGLAVADGRLYLSTADGKLLCLAAE